MDASMNGDDTFFITSSRLTSQDQDTAVDVYDAHVCSHSVPCVQSAVSPPPCVSGDSCKAAPTPQPSIFGAPASATFLGAGNQISQPAIKPKTKGGGLSRAQKLRQALNGCARRYRNDRNKRHVCVQRVRKRYGKASGRSSGRVVQGSNGGNNRRGR
jgi:hypothetical protein